MKKNKKNKVVKMQRFLFKSFTVTTILLIIGIVYSRATLARINLEVQNLNDEIKESTENNQSLVMRINEMVSLEKIQEVSSKQGLTYKNQNIVSITE